MSGMVKLPARVEIHVGGKVWRGEAPADLCPAKYLPAAKPARAPRSVSANEPTGESGEGLKADA